LESRGFARAVRPNEAEDLTFVDIEADTPNRLVSPYFFQRFFTWMAAPE